MIVIIGHGPSIVGKHLGPWLDSQVRGARVSDFFEYDPMTGIRTDTSWDENTQQMTLIRSADVEPVLNYTKAMANDASISKDGIAESWWLYAKLPPIVMLQMRAKGIIVGNRDHEKRIFEEINQNYPYLKCTTGNHGGKIKVHG